MNISLEYYKIFCKVAECKSMTAASQELYITQPAVSMAIKTLEDRLGGKLFFRTAKGIVLTTEGKTLYEQISAGLSTIQKAEEGYSRALALSGGEIRIGASDTICSYYLIPYLERFNQLYPEIAIKVVNRMSGAIIKLLCEGEIDIGFVNLPLDSGDQTEIYRCMEIHDAVIGGTKYKGLSLSGAEELNNYPLLLLEKGSASRKFIDETVQAAGSALHPLIELGSNDMLVRFARINLGLAVIPHEFIQDELDGKTLFEIPVKGIPPRHIGMAVRKGMPLSSSAAAFRQYFLKEE